MATKISQLTEKTNPDDGDLVEIVDQATGDSKRSTIQNIVEGRAGVIAEEFELTADGHFTIDLPPGEYVDVVIVQMQGAQTSGGTLAGKVIGSGGTTFSSAGDYELVRRQHNVDGTTSHATGDDTAIRFGDGITDEGNTVAPLTIRFARPLEAKPSITWWGAFPRDGFAVAQVDGVARLKTTDGNGDIDKVEFLVGNNGNGSNLAKFRGFVIAYNKG